MNERMVGIESRKRFQFGKEPQRDVNAIFIGKISRSKPIQLHRHPKSLFFSEMGFVNAHSVGVLMSLRDSHTPICIIISGRAQPSYSSKKLLERSYISCLVI
ncbi:uncharacterized protein [Henckelia pumila]|uniref:uncharacterized protein n=1 Tax=Henckelia pumila TaxID=405737 RepID=UPI003C6E4729